MAVVLLMHSLRPSKHGLISADVEGKSTHFIDACHAFVALMQPTNLSGLYIH